MLALHKVLLAQQSRPGHEPLRLMAITGKDDTEPPWLEGNTAVNRLTLTGSGHGMHYAQLAHSLMVLTKIAAPATERIVFPSVAASDALDPGIAIPLPAVCAAADAWVLQVIGLHPELLVVEPGPAWSQRKCWQSQCDAGSAAGMRLLLGSNDHRDGTAMHAGMLA